MFINGNLIAAELERKLNLELSLIPPKKICFIVLSDNAATEQFVKMKSRVACRIGIIVETKRHTEITTTKEAVALVRSLATKNYDGIVVQLPLPEGIDTQTVLDAVPPEKDIDVLGTVAKEQYAQGKLPLVPPVAGAVYEVLRSCNIDLTGKKIVIAGRGRLVGEPVHLMFTRMNIPHRMVDEETSESEKLALFKDADIIVSGMGVPHVIQPEMIQSGVILIDAGTSEQNGKLVGDIDSACENKASAITPVPGGIGPLTIVCLLRNLL